MTNLFLLSILVGAVLGMRLRVLILVPAIGFFLAGIAGIGGARGDELWSIATAMILAAIGLQIGYLSGSTSRFVMAASRARHRRATAASRQGGDRQAVRA